MHLAAEDLEKENFDRIKIYLLVWKNVPGSRNSGNVAGLFLRLTMFQFISSGFFHKKY